MGFLPPNEIDTVFIAPYIVQFFEVLVNAEKRKVFEKNVNVSGKLSIFRALYGRIGVWSGIKSR